MGAPDRAVFVRHRGQHDDLGARSASAAIASAAPSAAACQSACTAKKSSSNAVTRSLSTSASGRGIRDVAVQPERGGVELQPVRAEKADEGPDEFEQHLVDVEHQERPRVARQLGDLAGGLGIVAHLLPAQVEAS